MCRRCGVEYQPQAKQCGDCGDFLEWVRDEPAGDALTTTDLRFQDGAPDTDNSLWERLGPGDFLCQLTIDRAVSALRLVADLKNNGFEAAYLPLIRPIAYGVIHSTPWFGYQILDHLAEQPWHVPRNEDVAHEPLLVFVRPEDLPGVEAFMRDRWERHLSSPMDQPLDFSTDTCPACGSPLPEDADECLDCGLRF